MIPIGKCWTMSLTCSSPLKSNDTVAARCEPAGALSSVHGDEVVDGRADEGVEVGDRETRLSESRGHHHRGQCDRRDGRCKKGPAVREPGHLDFSFQSLQTQDPIENLRFSYPGRREKNDGSRPSRLPPASGPRSLGKPEAGRWLIPARLVTHRCRAPKPLALTRKPGSRGADRSVPRRIDRPVGFCGCVSRVIADWGFAIKRDGPGSEPPPHLDQRMERRELAVAASGAGRR